MNIILSLLALVSLTFLIIGFFKPKASLFWDNNNPTRKKSTLIFGSLTILFFISLRANTENKNPTKLSVNKTDTIDTKKKNLFDDPNGLILKLSENGIGELKEWKNPSDLGWGSFTDYFQFGLHKDVYGMQNNIAYYVDGTETNVRKVCVNLNINNPTDKKKALKFYNKIVEKTFASLDISIPSKLTNSILQSKKYKEKIDGYIISNELEKTKINTWKVNIERE